ncbi:MAG: helix-hairpin-helix domain-containing protein [Phaeodactylibacter sp.]|nr:helix-hairpin-helix domain-containing protein [Phaeodactylibacter sp.]MCB9051500.1 helix-hairpin-helix domain-containing protein [Lewinellaceae bacterium]
MRSFFQEYFYYSRAERNGAFVLALLCVVFFLFPRVYPHFRKHSGGAGFEQYQGEAFAFFDALQAIDSSTQRPRAQLFYFDPNTISMDSLLLLGVPLKTAGTIIRYREKVGPFRRTEDLRKIYSLEEADYQRLAPYIRLFVHSGAGAPARQVKMQREEENTPLLQPFPFDPNTVTEEELGRLGLPERLARNILKYREKGGRFREPESLKKIYGMEEDTYLALAPFIRIGEPARLPRKAEAAESEEERPQAYSAVPATPVAIDINRADEQAWQQLYGIGPGYARRIVRFREKLGGFAHIGQVGETYGLPDSTFQQILPQLRMSPVFRKLHVNTADAETLKAHPYLDWRMANAIVNYRAQHGPFVGMEDLHKVKALPTDVVERLEAYVAY